MRTTITLDPDTEQLLRQAVARERRSFKRVVNDAIRSGLRPASSSRKNRPVSMPTFAGPYAPGVDRHRLQQLADQLETDRFESTHQAAR